jgi:hypothetical protein
MPSPCFVGIYKAARGAEAARVSTEEVGVGTHSESEESRQRVTEGWQKDLLILHCSEVSQTLLSQMRLLHGTLSYLSWCNCASGGLREVTEHALSALTEAVADFRSELGNTGHFVYADHCNGSHGSKEASLGQGELAELHEDEIVKSEMQSRGLGPKVATPAHGSSGKGEIVTPRTLASGMRTSPASERIREGPGIFSQAAIIASPLELGTVPSWPGCVEDSASFGEYHDVVPREHTDQSTPRIPRRPHPTRGTVTVGVKMDSLESELTELSDLAASQASSFDFSGLAAVRTIRSDSLAAAVAGRCPSLLRSALEVPWQYHGGDDELWKEVTTATPRLEDLSRKKLTEIEDVSQAPKLSLSPFSALQSEPTESFTLLQQPTSGQTTIPTTPRVIEVTQGWI